MKTWAYNIPSELKKLTPLERLRLGIGYQQPAPTSTYAPLVHTHVAADITAGTIATARLGSGAASSASYLRGDQTWALLTTITRMPYSAKTGTYVITTADGIINCTSGTFTVTLPTAASIAGQRFVVKNSGAGTITVACNGAETIDGVATAALATYDALEVASDGANWMIL